MIAVQRASIEDDAKLARLDVAAWAPSVTPAPRPLAGSGFFEKHRRPSDVLIGLIDGSVAGFAHIGQSIPVASHRHVLELMGLCVDPSQRRRGIGRRLLDEAVQDSFTRGARKISLRVLKTNDAARRLYEASGFIVEGVLRDEFLIDGKFVDDILMALARS